MKRTKQLVSLLLAAMLLIGLLPVTALATGSVTTLTVASRATKNLAPGVTETTVVSYDSNNDRVQYFVVNADIATNDTVQFKANYHDNDNTGVWGKATVIEQANAAKQKRGYNVVVSQNASYYNVSTGQPTGAFVMEGVNINGTATGNAYQFFAILDDGSAVIGDKNEFGNYADHVVEAIGGYRMLVKNGAVISGLDNSSKYPRSTIGIKADGNIVLMLADGNNKPYSAGLTYAEQAQLMLELGCVDAIELDGGGSATYASKYEGEDEIQVRNVCCDGTVRSVSNTMMIISTAVADGTFDHANLSTEYAYYAANSDVQITASGADAAGNAAVIPAEAHWALGDDSFGTVADGVFHSTGKTGTVAVNLLVGDAIVGSIDVTVVHPTSIAFSAEEKTVPYGKTSDFTITSMYNGAEVYAAADAFDFDVAIGTMNGFIYTAPEESAEASATVTATYKYAEGLVASVTAVFGKGSEILFDFEDGDISEWGTQSDIAAAEASGAYTRGYTAPAYGGSASNYVAQGIRENVFLASKAEGYPVYSGDYSLAYTIDYSQQTEYCNWLYGYLYYWGEPIVLRDTETGVSGTRIGMWMYIPPEAVGTCSRLAYTYKQANGAINTAYLYFTYMYVSKGFSKLTSDKIPEAGWAYVYCDLDQISTTYVSTSYYKDEDGNLTRAVASNYAPAFIQWIVSSSATGAEKVTFYIDDITLDYSDVVADRDAPIISSPIAMDDLSSYALNGSASGNKFSFSAAAIEDTTHGSNYTGLDAATAQIYVDGQAVGATYSAGYISCGEMYLANGVHDVTFEIADKQGNYTKLTRQFTVNGSATYPTITVTGEPVGVNAAGKLYMGGQYNVKIGTDQAEAIDTVTAKIWLNSCSTWALSHITVADGFTATAYYDDVTCLAEITISRTDSTLTGAQTLVTIPAYAWAWDGSAGIDAHTQWTSKGTAPQLTLDFDVKYGEVTYTDAFTAPAGYLAGFGKGLVSQATELNTSIANLKNTIGEWHYHTATAVEDVAPTCTTTGCTGKTVCSVCGSVVDWGTVIPATGHTFVFNTDGVLVCTNDETHLFTGTWTDGKDYVDGVLKSSEDGWSGSNYYVDGAKVKGVYEIDGVYYDFGEDGVSKGAYTGLFTKDGYTYYAVVGSLVNGWQLIEDNYYYFNTTNNRGWNGKLNGGNKGWEVQFTMENGRITQGEWVTKEAGTRYYYGPNCYVHTWATIGDAQYYFGDDTFRYEGYRWIHDSHNARDLTDCRLYHFDEDGKLLETLESTGVLETADGVFYLEEGYAQHKGLASDGNGHYYYFDTSLQAVTDQTRYVSEKWANGLLPAGTYTFGADGKLALKNGIVSENEKLYYYVNGQRTHAGLIEIDSKLYYVKTDGEVVTNVTRYVDALHSGGYPAGTYTFGADGASVTKNGIVEEGGKLYYYVDGVLTHAGLIKIEDSFYYVKTDGEVVTNVTRYVDALHANGYPAGTYSFGADGASVVLDGIVEQGGKLYYYENGVLTHAGLIQLGGKFYYVKTDGEVVTNVTRYVDELHANGYGAGTYTFGADGAALISNGIVDEGGTLYYYVNGAKTHGGLVAVDGFYYYAKTDGSVAVNVTRTIDENHNNGLLEPGVYKFNAFGQIVDEFDNPIPVN